jgi:hypothetical protein
MEDAGVYAPRPLPARFVLGMQGAMAADALGWWRQRAREACAQTSRRGHGMWAVPVGCGRPAAQRLATRADRQVPQALEGVCKQLRDLGRARQTRRWARDAPLPLPEVHPWDSRPRQPLAAAQWPAAAPETDPSLRGWRARLGAPRGPARQRRGPGPAKDPADKAPGAGAPRAAGAAAWLPQLGHVASAPPTLGGHAGLASRRSRGRCHTGTGGAAWRAAVRALRAPAPGCLERHPRARATGGVPGRPGRPGLLVLLDGRGPAGCAGRDRGGAGGPPARGGPGGRPRARSGREGA